MARNRSERGKFPDKSPWKLSDDSKQLGPLGKLEEIARETLPDPEEMMYMWRKKEISKKDLEDIRSRIEPFAHWAGGGGQSSIIWKLLGTITATLAAGGTITWGLLSLEVGKAAALAIAGGASPIIAIFLIGLGAYIARCGSGKE